MAFTQDLRTQRRNYPDGDTRIGEEGRIWFDSKTYTLRVGDGFTGGGVIIGGIGGGGGAYILPTASPTILGGVKIDNNTITIDGSGVISTSFSGDFSDLTNVPTLFDGNYNSLTGKPTNVSSFANDAGYLTSQISHDDVVVDGDFPFGGLMTTDGHGNYTITTNFSTRWNEAWGWGNHADAGYITELSEETDPIVGAVNGLVKADGLGNISAAIPGTDYSVFDGQYNSLIGARTDLSEFSDNTNIISTSISTAISNASANDLTDITLTAPNTGDLLVYNGSTSAFENLNINLTGGSSNQVLVKQSGAEYDYAWEEMIVEQKTYTKLIDDESEAGILYLGEATPNTTESSGSWRIQKIIFDINGNVDEVRFAAGGAFSQVWNNRLALVYS